MALFKMWWFRYAAALALLFLAHLAYGGYLTAVPISLAPPKFDPRKVEELIAAGGTENSDDPLLTQPGICWLTGYRGGYVDRQEFSLWEPRGAALGRLLQDGRWRECEAVEVGVATNTTNYHQEPMERADTGLWGLLLRCSNGDLLLSPVEFPRRSQFLDGQAAKYQLERTVLRQAKFQALTWVLRRDDRFRPQPLVAGDRLVAPGEVDVEKALHALAAFQQKTLREGLLPYRYSASTGAYSEEERDLVRVCLGSLSLAKYARYTGRPEDRSICDRHLKTMIARYGHRWEDRACISDSDVALLGAQALFAMALRVHAEPSLQDFEAGLRRTLLASRKEDGHFETRLPLPWTKPPEPSDPEKDENQNSHPGMALAYLGELSPAPEIDKSLQYYRKRFQRRPDRAAIPWLAQAFARRGDSRTVFTLVDWNLDNLQEWEKMEPRLRGAVINPDRVHYGKSCFTYEQGAQLQGVVTAAKMARGERAQRYRKAFQEMSRYLVQMQIRSKGDLYWLPPDLRETPVGGMRDVGWNYRMQVDSSAGALNAWLDWVQE